MQRNKGQFASARALDGEARAVANWDGTAVPAQGAGPVGMQAEVMYVLSLCYSILVLSYSYHYLHYHSECPCNQDSLECSKGSS